MTMHTTTSPCPRYVSEEVCPLCLGRYSTASERICASCEAPSCPECAAPIPGSAEVLCFACHGTTRH